MQNREFDLYDYYFGGGNNQPIKSEDLRPMPTQEQTDNFINRFYGNKKREKVLIKRGS